jgi:DNA-binding IclR family transcriptional regulator
LEQLSSEVTKTKKETGGVRSIDRAIEILRALAFSNSVGGIRFSDLQAATGLSKGTLHRILAAVMTHGFVEQDASTRRYFLGLEFLALGARAGNRFDLQSIAHPSLVRLAKRTGDTAYLSIRSGIDSVCIDREEGAYPIKTLTLSIGTRRPLGIGSGSLALLSFLPDQEVKDIIRRNRARLASYPNHGYEDLLERVEETRHKGYAVNDGRILKGMCGVGVPVFGYKRRVVAALSTAAISSRMEPDRRQEIVVWLNQEAKRIAAILGGDSVASEKINYQV